MTLSFPIVIVFFCKSIVGSDGMDSISFGVIMRIEEGGRYYNRKRKLVIIKGRLRHTTQAFKDGFRFEDTLGQTYRENGTASSFSGLLSDHDLITVV